MNTPTKQSISSFWQFGLISTVLGIATTFALGRISSFGKLDPDVLAYCEATSGNWLRQPANSLANIAFFWVGAAIFAGVGNTHGRRMPSRGTDASLRVGFALGSVCIGMGSLLFHATLSDWAGFADNFAMNLMATQMMVHSWARTFRWSTVRSLAVLISVNLGLDLLVLTHNLGRLLFGIVVTVTIVTEISIALGRSPLVTLGRICGFRVRQFTRDPRLLFATVATFVVGAVVWRHSRTGALWCSPGSLLQGHAFWHLASACAVYFDYLYLGSERRLAAEASVASVPIEEPELDSMARLLAADAE